MNTSNHDYISQIPPPQLQVTQYETPPPRGRDRYPAYLAKGRIPLHRRGTSRTLETFDDLLREAGYKETRIFTPEAERREAEEEAQREKERSGAGGGVEAVVNFFSALIPKNGRSQNGQMDTETISRPPSSHGHHEAPGTPTPKQLHPKSSLASMTSDSFSSPRTPFSSSFVTESSSNNSLLKPQPTYPDSAARNALRHMYSAPSIPQRRPHNHPHVVDLGDQPPLPPNWLQTATQAAARFGPNSGVHIGRPASACGYASTRRHNQNHTHGHLNAATQHRRSRSSHRTHSKLALMDNTNKIVPPHAQRSCTCPSTVTTTSVVCRSTPTSRSNSRVRGNSSSRRGKGKSRDVSPVPNLSATVVETGAWAMTNGNTNLVLGENDNIINLNDSDTDDSDDDRELDLARLLVPSKRQKSIHSLRRHLHLAMASEMSNQNVTASASLRAVGSTVSFRSISHDGPRYSTNNNSRRTESSMGADDSFEATIQNQIRRSRRGSFDEDEQWEWDVLAGHGPGVGERSSKKRTVLPWSSWVPGKS